MRPTASLSLFAATAFAFSATAGAAGDGIMYLVTTTQKSVADKGHKGEQVEIQSFHWGPRQSTSADGARGGTAIGGAIGGWANDGSEAAAARRGGGNQLTMDDTAGREKVQTAGGGGAVGANETMTVGSGRTETGQATGKRQHKPFVVSGYYDAPLPRGSVRVKVKMPWLACRVGAAYPRLELAGGGRRYVLEGVTVASCGGSSADDRPTEEVAFYYNKIG